MRTILIVGAGLAGATAAATLREDGFEGRIVLVGEEPRPPYERPPLSKEFLRGEMTLEETQVRPAEWYPAEDVELVVDRVASLNLDRPAATLAGGGEIRFDSALLVTGSTPRRLAVPGADLDGILELRTAEDAMRLREAAEQGARALVVGLGFIGSEVAASLRSLGLDVTGVHPQATPLERVLGPEIGRVVEAEHRDHGVHLVLGDTVEAFEGAGRVEAAVTGSGRRIECDLAVVGVGVQPNDALAGAAGLPTPNGVAVDAALRTRHPAIFAAGDVALHDHPVFGEVRVEHYDNAIKMGQAAARSMLGSTEPFDDPHWFWSDQHDLNIQVSGHATSWDRMVVRGSLAERSFCAFCLRDGVLLSAISVNRPRDVRRAMPLIAARARPDPDRLADPAVDLRSLLEPA